MNQNFSSQQLIKLCKQYEWEDFELTKDNLEKQINDNFERILNGSFTFNLKQIGDYFLVEDLPQKLILRKLNDNLERLYKDEQANRRIIIKQVKALLEENGPMWILKTDIEKFYDSIDRDRLISKFHNDSLVSFHSLQLLSKLFDDNKLALQKGVPRGLNISATLSEIYMRKFDRWVRTTTGIYYYARFVDDIIIFSNNEEVVNNIRQNINSRLEKGLRKKEVKTDTYKGENIRKSKPLEYLGYKFTTETVNKKKKLSISIAEKKVKKIKSRITYAFLDFNKSKDFDLLEQRIKFLTGNFSVKRNKEGNDLKAGIYYNYPLLTDYSVLNKLNLYYRKALYSKNGSFGYKLSSNLSSTQKNKLSKYSFKYGYLNKVYNSFTPDEMDKIKGCWDE
jgi:hypothetical protein